MSSVGIGHQMSQEGGSIKNCLKWLQSKGHPIVAPEGANDSPWCNATWDGLMCWSAVPGGSYAKSSCPDISGLDTTKTLKKLCHTSGQWRGVNDTDFSKEAGFTPYLQQCLLIDEEVLGPAKILAGRARILEFVGLGCSFVALTIAVFIFSSFRRLRVFRTQLHLNLMVALLVVVIVRLALYIDQGIDMRDGSQINGTRGIIIHQTVVVCEMSYVVLEYFKTVTFAWMFLEGLYLCNSIVLTVYQSEPNIWIYMAVGWGGSLIHTLIWLVVMLIKGVNGCLRNYFLDPTFWILDGPRMLELALNLAFIISVIWVLWSKVKDSYSETETAKMKKSVKAAFMLIILLGVPNVTQTIPLTPTMANFTGFTIYTYAASFFYMFQGFMIAIVYCFTNKEVIMALKTGYERNQLRRSTAATVASRHRESRAPSIPPKWSPLARLRLLKRFSMSQSRSGNQSPHVLDKNGTNVGPGAASHKLSPDAMLTASESNLTAAPPVSDRLKAQTNKRVLTFGGIDTFDLHDDQTSSLLGEREQNGGGGMQLKPLVIADVVKPGCLRTTQSSNSSIMVPSIEENEQQDNETSEHNETDKV